ncbi:hypothetical protein ACUN9Y_17625 [Halomonas sp. V046]|uniref:hypothetical protein n=1 Tax=Halomonas sp. V046 TaxID=3459611 RepID=UPI0040439EDA
MIDLIASIHESLIANHRLCPPLASAEDERRRIGWELSGAQTILSREALQRLGPQRLAEMMVIARRFDTSIADVIEECLRQPPEALSVLCSTRERRKKEDSHRAGVPYLRLVEPRADRP